jgi:tetratricopeptide (TPR) repeat protein
MIGDEEAAFRAIDGASRIMGTLESTSREDARAIFGEEATKTWKGDPYERCMNALYKGLLYWRRGDLGNAAACFKRGLLADAWSASGKHQRDFAVLAYLLGWVSHLRGQEEQASFSFREAAELKPENLYFADPRPDQDNVLVIVGLGRGPNKRADGHHGNIVRFDRRHYPEGGIEILEGNRSLGRSALATDLYRQAITRGNKKIDGIRRGKAVFKTASAVAGLALMDRGIARDRGELVAAGLGLLVLSVLTRAEADTRCWSLLPGELHVLPMRLEPGPHVLEVRVLDRSGRPLVGWARLFPVEVPPRGDSLYYFRTGLGRTVYGLTEHPPRP